MFLRTSANAIATPADTSPRKVARSPNGMTQRRNSDKKMMTKVAYVTIFRVRYQICSSLTRLCTRLRLSHRTRRNPTSTTIEISPLASLILSPSEVANSCTGRSYQVGQLGYADNMSSDQRFGLK